MKKIKGEIVVQNVRISIWGKRKKWSLPLDGKKSKQNLDWL